MKKLVSLMLVLSMSVFSLVGCSKPASEPAPAPTEPAKEEPATDAVKTGLAVITSVEKSKAPEADKEGTAEVNSLVVAVTVDKDGKIVKAAIDSAQTKINFNAQGKITTDLATVFKSKQELGTEYGMAKASKIGKEWNEQADAFEALVEGKTIAEVKGFALDAETHLTDADMVSSVTIKVGDLIGGVEKAVANAQDLGATADDKLGLGVLTNIAKSKDAAADAEGDAQAYSYYTATTFDADGKVSSSIIDASVTDVKFDATGKITTDLAAELKSKNELGDAYGMKKASKIGKEWYEQAAAFAEYVVGKTLAEVNGIAVDAEKRATGADLVSSVTVHVGEFQEIIAKAEASAK